MFRKKTTVIEEEKSESEAAIEQKKLLARIIAVESTVALLSTEVHELQLAKKKYHGDD